MRATDGEDLGNRIHRECYRFGRNFGSPQRIERPQNVSVGRPIIEGHQVGKVQPGSHLSLPHFFEAAPEVGPPAFAFLSSAASSLTSSLTAGSLPTSSSRLSRSACRSAARRAG